MHWMTLRERAPADPRTDDAIAWIVHGDPRALDDVLRDTTERDSSAPDAAVAGLPLDRLPAEGEEERAAVLVLLAAEGPALDDWLWDTDGRPDPLPSLLASLEPAHRLRALARIAEYADLRRNRAAAAALASAPEALLIDVVVDRCEHKRPIRWSSQVDAPLGLGEWLLATGRADWARIATRGRLSEAGRAALELALAPRPVAQTRRRRRPARAPRQVHPLSLIREWAHAYEHVLTPSLTPCVGLVLGAPNRRSRSRVGGSPDVPVDFRWPTHDGRPIDFVLQVDLSELAGLRGAEDLPPHGVLSLFFDLLREPRVDTEGAHRVYWFPNATALTPRKPPRMHTCLEPSGVAFYGAWSIPRIDDGESWVDEVDELGDLLRNPSRGPQHHLLGAVSPIQDDIGPIDAPGGWRLLLQLDSDEDAGLQWGIYGRLYVIVRRDDLAARRFDRTWAEVQFS